MTDRACSVPSESLQSSRPLARGDSCLRALSEHVSEARLRLAGIPVVPGRRFADLKALEQDCLTLEYPVALKASAEGLQHKTELKALQLDIKTPEALLAAAGALSRRGIAEPFELLVQQMAPPGIEAIVGVQRDPVFGPVMMFGVGGVLAELYQDTALCPIPLTRSSAQTLIASIRGVALLQGFRGEPAIDQDALIDVLMKVSDLVERDPQIQSMDINPLRLYPRGCLALDASLVISGGAEAPGPSVAASLVGTDAPLVGVAAGVPSGVGFGAGGNAEASAVEALWSPASIAVVGVSRTPGKAGRVILENLQRAGFPGALYPINPEVETLSGLPCYPSISCVPGPVDLAILAVPRVHVSAALEEAAAAGVRSFIVPSGGFSDAGDAGRMAELALATQARRLGVRVLGPNSIGVIDPDRGLNTSITTLQAIPTGNIGLVGQTGLFASGFAAQVADKPPFGIGRIICLGNRADLDEADALESLAVDDRIEAVGMYLEGVKDGPRFVRALRRLTEHKPLVVLKGGRSKLGATAVASHTGSLAGRDKVFSAVMSSLGVIEARSFTDLFLLLRALSYGARPLGRRLGVVSVSGAGCVLAVDVAEARGLEVPALSEETLVQVRTIVPEWAPVGNPLDLWSGIEQWGGAEAYRRCGMALLQQADVDALLVAFAMIPEADFDVAAVFGSLREAYPDKPLYSVLFGGDREMLGRWRSAFHEIGIPSYRDVRDALEVMGRLAF